MRDYSRLDATMFRRSRVADLHVLVAGAGALGNEVLKNFALIGVREVIVVDRDHIEPSNLPRSVLFCTRAIQADLEQRTPKAVRAAARVSEINPDVETTAFVGEVADLGTGVLRRIDVAFSCVDNEMARLELSWMCSRLNKPLIDGGLGLLNPSSGLVSIFPGVEGPCYACRKGRERRRLLLQELHGRSDSCAVTERVNRERGIVSTTPTMASVVGAMQVELGLRRLLDEALGARGSSTRVMLHPRIQIETMHFERSPLCPLHDPASVPVIVDQRRDKSSDEWTAAELLAETVRDREAVLRFDWPITAAALCRACGHRWEPMVRRARFRGQRCPSCTGSDVAETETLDGVHADSEWATRTLAALGLPRGHIHQVVVGTGPGAVCHHVEVTGDLIAANRRAAA